MKNKLFLLILSIFFLLQLNAQNWNQTQKIVASNRLSGNEFGTDVSICGNYAIVGSPFGGIDTIAPNNISKTGCAYIFKKDSNNNWIQVQILSASDKSNADRFGCSVSIIDKFAIVGAYYEDDDANGNNPMSNSGSAYIFEKDSSGIWVEVQKVVAFDRDNMDFFGGHVAISDNYAIIGAFREDHDETGNSYMDLAGSAYIFQRHGISWNLLQKIVASDRDDADFFGNAVSIHGKHAVVGASNDEDDSTKINPMGSAGSAYIFEKDTSGFWTQVQKINSNDREISDRFGNTVSICGDYTIIGAYCEDHDTSASNYITASGSAYVFERNTNGIWSQTQKIVPSDRDSMGFFGSDVSINGNRVIVGAPYQDQGFPGPNSLYGPGAAYLFEKDTNGIWHEVEKICASDKTNMDFFGGHVAISDNYALVGATGEDEDHNGQNTLLWAGSAYLFKTCSNVIDDSVTQTGLSLIANHDSANYQWLDCNNGYAIIAGAINQSFTPIANGSYAVEITENGCVDTSACYLVTGVGISENDFGSSLNFYPNPTSGKININLGKPYKTIDVSVKNVMGQIVLSKTYKTTNQLSFEIKGSSGVYFVEIKTDIGSSAVLKILKQ